MFVSNEVSAGVVGFVSLLAFIGYGIQRLQPNMSDKARWYLIHCITNGLVVVWSFPYVVDMLSTPSPKFDESVSMGPSIVVMSLHLYHCLFYKLNHGDVVHHTVMMLILLIPMILKPEPRFIGFSNYSVFFLCGLPGGIDYYLMYKVETGTLLSLTEKRINVALNTWIRSIGILYGVFYCYRQWLEGLISLTVMLPAAMALTWNAQYYSSEVSQSYGFHRSIALAQQGSAGTSRAK